jgi:hypothetical protein
LDGTLTDIPGGGVVESKNAVTLNDPACKIDSRFSNAVICSNQNTRVRVSYTPNPTHSSTVTNIRNNQMTSSFSCFRLIQIGIEYTLEVNQTYSITHYDSSLTTANQIKYNGGFFGMKPNEYLIIQHPISGRQPDQVYLLNGKLANQSDTPLSPLSNNNGDWYWDNNTHTLSFILLNQNTQPFLDHVLNVSAKFCQFAGCVTPSATPVNLTTVSLRPANAIFWSNASTWTTLGQPKPKDYDSVTIPFGQFVVVDCDLPKLTNLQIDGALEFDNGRDHYLEVYVS